MESDVVGGSELEPQRPSDLEPEGASELDLLASALRADLTDINAFVEGLATKLEGLLPGMCAVERRKQGLRGPRLVTRIRLDNGNQALELRRQGSVLTAVRARSSGGITLKSEQIELDQWLDEVGRLVATTAAKSERARQAMERLLLGG